MNQSLQDRYGQSRQRGGGNGRAAWQTFLQPGWIITAVLIIGFSYFAFTFLAPWQWGKDEAIQERNAQITESFDVDPVSWSQIFDPTGAVIDDGHAWRRVTMTGHFDTEAEHEAVLRMRPADSGPSIQALTPFDIDGGPTVLVNRGLERAEGAGVPDFASPPSGQVTITGVARINEQAPENPIRHELGHWQVSGINTDEIAEATGVDLGEDYVQLLEDQPGVLEPVPIPTLDRGSHLSYAFQWVAFGIMAPLGLAYFVRSEIKERRRLREEEEAMAEGEEIISEPDDDRPTGLWGRKKAERESFKDQLFDDDEPQPDIMRAREQLHGRYGS